MKKSVLYAATLFLMVFAVKNVNAQNVAQNKKVELLDEVVVSDTRFKIKKQNSGKVVAKITRDDIEKNPTKTVAEFVNEVSGIEVNGIRGVAGQQISVFSRGGNNRQVLVIVDGIQVSDPSNINAEFDLRFLATDQIESIEVLKGAASTLYGNSAATVVINITTKKATNAKVKLIISKEIGTNQTAKNKNLGLRSIAENASVSGTLGDFTYLAGINYEDVNGLSSLIGNESDEFVKHSYITKIGYQTKNIKLGLLATFKDNAGGYDSGGNAEDELSEFKNKTVITGITSSYIHANGSMNLNAGYTKSDRDFIGSFKANAKKYTADIFNKYIFNKSIHTIVGVNYINDEVIFSTGTKSASSLDPYVNMVYVSKYGLNVNLGGRLNHHKEYGNNFVYNINPSYTLKIDKGYAKIFGSYSTAFIAPTISQLFGSFGANPNVNPEQNLTKEIGLTYSVNKKATINATYFNRKEQNKIIYVVTDFVTYAGSYDNATSPTKITGVEIDVTLKPTKNLKVSSNYTFTESKDNVILRVPKHKVNANASYMLGKNNIGLGYQFVDHRGDVGNVNLAAFKTFDLRYSYQLSRSLLLYIAVNNIFNEDYTERAGYSTLGRNFFTGAKFQF